MNSDPPGKRSGSWIPGCPKVQEHQELQPHNPLRAGSPENYPGRPISPGCRRQDGGLLSRRQDIDEPRLAVSSLLTTISANTGPKFMGRPSDRKDADSSRSDRRSQRRSARGPLRFLASSSMEEILIAQQADSRDVTLRAIDKFAPSGAVTAPKIHRSATFGDFLRAFRVVNIGKSEVS